MDSSALIAILREEADAPRLLAELGMAQSRRISAASYLEAAIVIDAERDPVASRRFDDFLSRAQIEISAVTPSQALIARHAYRDFGKGSGHAARLNFGDCFSYALAKECGEPLLFKGDDFTHAGIDSA